MTDKIYINDREMSIAEFQAADGLSVGGSLDLSGTKITALPDNLTVGGWLDLSGTKTTALPDNLTVGSSLDLSGTRIKPVGKDARGYEFFAVHLSNGPRVIAGCRNFSPDEAREHWEKGTECRALAEKCIALLEAGV